MILNILLYISAATSSDFHFQEYTFTFWEFWQAEPLRCGGRHGPSSSTWRVPANQRPAARCLSGAPRPPVTRGRRLLIGEQETRRRCRPSDGRGENYRWEPERKVCNWTTANPGEMARGHCSLWADRALVLCHPERLASETVACKMDSATELLRENSHLEP